MHAPQGHALKRPNTAMSAYQPDSPPDSPPPTSYAYAPTQIIQAAGTHFAYRELGPQGGTPLLLLNHWGAVLDNFDPRIVDGLASKQRVIAVDYLGIGLSGGVAPRSVDEMARDTIALIQALGVA
jgi:pimeloyl-ACP methyl ester carboxylesterase